MAFLTRTMVLATVFAAACGDATGIVHRGPVLRTEQAEYSIQDAREGKIGLVLLNAGTTPLMMTGCPTAPDAHLERFDEGWPEPSGSICLGIYTVDFITLAPGESRSFSSSAYQAGRYRIRVPLGADADGHARAVFSNEFIVR